MRKSSRAHTAATCCLVALLLPVTATAFPDPSPPLEGNYLRLFQAAYRKEASASGKRRLGVYFINSATLNPSTKTDMMAHVVSILWVNRYPGLSIETAHTQQTPEYEAFSAFLRHGFNDLDAVKMMFGEVYDHLQKTGQFEALMNDLVLLEATKPQDATRQAQRAAPDRPSRSSDECSVTATVAANSNLAATFSGCYEHFTIQFAKLPVAISEELLRQAEERGVKIRFDLSAPFLRWLIRTDRLAFDGSDRNNGGQTSGAGAYATIESQVFLPGLGSCHVKIEGSTWPSGFGEMCFILLKLGRLVSQGELETLQHLIDDYLDYAVPAAPASPTATEIPR